MITLLAIIFFVVGYVAISLEHKFHLNKSAIALFMGGVLWTLVASTSHGYEEMLVETSAEVFEIVIFLLAAMSLVEILVHYKLFDVIRGKIYALGFGDRKQFIALASLAFLLSGVIDNLTATIVMIQIARKFFKGETLVKMCALIVIAANAGGAFSPIGDVTTIMLWLADKFEATDIIVRGFLPSLVIFAVPAYMFYRKLPDSKFDEKDEIVTNLEPSEVVIVSTVFSSFVLAVVLSFVGLPPYFGLLIGLGLTWLVVDFFKHTSNKKSHLEASIEHLIQKTDIASIKFFIGILFSVAALHYLGVLEMLSSLVFGESPESSRIILGNVVLGLISPVLDNVPLTAMAIQILDTSVTSYWVLLALCVGTGGSLLVIGSAAGVVAMGMNKDLTFDKYFKLAFIPALSGFVAGITVWYLQYLIFFQ